MEFPHASFLNVYPKYDNIHHKYDTHVIVAYPATKGAKFGENSNKCLNVCCCFIVEVESLQEFHGMVKKFNLLYASPVNHHHKHVSNMHTIFPQLYQLQ